MRRRLSMFLAVAALVLTGLAGNGKADPVTVRAATHEGYGRMVFSWETPAQHSAAIENRTLTVRFARPVEGELTPITKALARYVSDIRVLEDGRSVAATLRGDYQLRDFDLGAAVVIDLFDTRPPPAASTPETRTDTTEAVIKDTAGAAPLIPVRSGVHKGYSRIVFDWPSRVGYRVDAANDTATIVFDRPAKVDVSALQRRPIRYITGIRADLRENELVVTMRTAEGSRLRHFLSGPKVVIDVLAPGGGEDTVAVGEETPKSVATAEKPAAASPRSLAPSLPAEPAASVRSVPADAASTRAQAAPADDGGGVEKPAESAISAEHSATSPGPVASLEAAKPEPRSSQPTRLSPPAQVDQQTESALPAAETAGQSTGGLDAVTLVFDWPEPVAAAVFRRTGYLWVVFDKPTEIVVERLKAQGGNLLRRVEQVPNQKGTAVRMETVTGVNPTLRRNGLAWLLEFRKQEIEPEVEIEVNPQPNSPVGARVFLPISEPGEAFILNDPEVGDSLAVVPVIPMGYGVKMTHEYPQFEILASAQGIVVRAKIDTLRVRTVRQGVEITSTDPLQISEVSDEVEANTKLGAFQPMSRIFDFDPERDKGLEGFNQDRHEFLQAIIRTRGMTRERARLDFAKFLLSRGMGAEVLGVLHVTENDRESIRKDSEFRALRGAAGVLMARYNEALEDLNDRGLDDNDEALFWRAVAQAGEGELVGAAGELIRKGPVIRVYPAALKIPLGMKVTEAATEVGDIRQARKFLEVLESEELPVQRQGELAYLRGRLAELSGNFDDAITEWEKSIHSNHRPSRAKASMARAELLLKLKKIEAPEAIGEMEKLRFAWRGDNFEFNLLRRLAELYMRENDYRAGLRTLRQLATNFRDHPKAKEISEEMAKAFTYLYLEGGADALAPVTAIALYDEFRELTPAGDKGDEMIRKLADRLVFVDLLPRAAELLENQVRFRLSGEEKARVGARLALVRILDRQPEKALEALDLSEVRETGGDLAQQRRHLRSQVLVGLGKVDEALDLIKGDDSPDADRLRAETYWQIKDWANAAQALRRLAQVSGAVPGRALDDPQARQVLNMAIALTLSGNERAIMRLRESYGAAMDGTSFKDAFRLIASPQTLGLIDYRTIASRVNDVENFQTFLAAYKERLRTSRLSAIN